MAQQTASFPSLPALTGMIFSLMAAIASWLDSVLAPFESEPALSPALIPAKFSETRTRRTTTARLHQRRALSAKTLLMIAHPVNHAHKWAQRVAKRRTDAVETPAATIRFPQPPASRRLESAAPAAQDDAQGGRADLFLRLGAGTGTRHVLARQQNMLARNHKLRPPVGGHHGAAFTPCPMTA